MTAFQEVVELGRRVALSGPTAKPQDVADFGAELLCVEEVAQALYAASVELSGWEGSVALTALSHIGVVVTCVTETLPPFFSDGVTSIWNDGTVAYGDERVRIPFADLTHADIREATLWLTGHEDQRPAMFEFNAGPPALPDL